jgi:hypothetical protein
MEPMTKIPDGPPEVGLVDTGPSVHSALRVLYTLVGLYGLSQTVAVSSTLRIVSGDAWAAAYPLLLLSFAIAAYVGVGRSQRRRRHRLELFSTIALMALLGGYVVVLILRVFFDFAELSRLPVAFLPIAVMVFPGWRLLWIVQDRINREAEARARMRRGAAA